MKILVIEQSKEQIEDLIGRVEEAAKRTLLKGLNINGSTLKEVGSFIPELIFLGAFAVKDLDDVLKRLNGIFPRVPVALLLSSEAYVNESIDLRRSFPLRIMAQGDIPQIAQMILDLADGPKRGRTLNKGRVLTVAHSKGGVGASSFAVSCADAISRFGKSVVLVDLALASPDITRWASYDLLQQSALKKFFLNTENSAVQIREIVKASPSSNLNLSVVGQLESYVLSFKMHVDVPDNAVSTFDSIERLLEKLTEDFEFVVLDIGNSWGVSALSALALSTQVCFVTEGTKQNMIRSLENVKRLSAESEDPSEFDFRKWSIIVNGTESMKRARQIYQDCEESCPLSTVVSSSSIPVWGMPISARGADWSISSYTLYAAGDRDYVSSIDEIVRGTFPDLGF